MTTKDKELDAKPAVKAPLKAPVTARAEVVYESREKEPSMFEAAEYWPIRNHANGRLEWSVPASDVERFERHFFVQTGRIVRKG